MFDGCAVPRTWPKVTPRFALGQLVATPGAIDLLNSESVSLLELVARHASGDWGNVCGEDWLANDDALEEGGRLLSAYRLPSGKKVWAITESDRSLTTVLRPEEY